jgi:aromatic amino acid aminotransferase I
MSQDAIEEQIFLATVDEGSLVTRGAWFLSNPEVQQEYMFFRATFAAAPLDKLEIAIQRFGNALRRVFELDEKKVEGTNGVNGH